MNRTIDKKVHIEFWNAMEKSKKDKDRLTFNPADNTYIKCLFLPQGCGLNIELEQSQK